MAGEVGGSVVGKIQVKANAFDGGKKGWG